VTEDTRTSHTVAFNRSEIILMIWNKKEERILNYPNNVLGFEAIGPANMLVFTFWKFGYTPLKIRIS
jgi:hypothetical protein